MWRKAFILTCFALVLALGGQAQGIEELLKADIGNGDVEPGFVEISSA